MTKKHAQVVIYPDCKGIDLVHYASKHPQTQGKYCLWHQTMNNRVLLESYIFSGDSERQINALVDQKNNHCYYENLANLTLADAHHGRSAKVAERKRELRNRQLEYPVTAPIHCYLAS